MVHESGRIIQYHLQLSYYIVQLKNEFYMISKITKNFMLNILFQHTYTPKRKYFICCYLLCFAKLLVKKPNKFLLFFLYE